MLLSKFFIISSGSLLYDTLQSPTKRYFITKKYYKLAKKLALEKNKKLIVIGDPCKGNSNIFKIIQKIKPNCEHGDITIDLYGCNKCTKIDINDLNKLKEFETNKYVVLESATLSSVKIFKKH